MSDQLLKVSLVWAKSQNENSQEDRLNELDHAIDPAWRTVEEFLANETERKRYDLPTKLGIDFDGTTIPIAIHVAWHAHYRASTVIASFSLPRSVTVRTEQTDLTIAILQSLQGRPSYEPGMRLTSSEGTAWPSLEAACRNELQLHGLNPDLLLNYAHRAWCIEERLPAGIDGPALRPADSQIYGMTTADEGWRFIDEASARQRLGTPWSTRNFVDVHTSGSGVYVRNGKSRVYTEAQGHFIDRHFGRTEPYFAVEPDVGGLDHGVLLALERVAIRYSLATRWLANAQEAASDRSISKERFRLVRSSLDDVNELLNSTLVAEVNSLEIMISDKMGLTPLVAQLDRLAEALDEQTRFAYETQVNTRISILTWITVVLTVATVVQGVLPFIID